MVERNKTVRGETTVAIILELSYVLLQTSFLCQRRNQISSQNNLITILDLSYYNLIAILFCSSTLLLLCQRINCQLSSQDYLITVLDLSYHCLIMISRPLLCVKGETTSHFRLMFVLLLLILSDLFNSYFNLSFKSNSYFQS